MKALTLTQPWASAVAAGAKQVETRGWSTRYRGPLWIHAAAGWTADDREFAADLMNAGIIPSAFVYTPRSIKPDLPLGAVIARCVLVSVLPTFAVVNGPRTDFAQHVVSWDERELGDFTHGRFAWFLADVEALKPTKVRGALGLWDWEP